jgi:hypothetical protein
MKGNVMASLEEAQALAAKLRSTGPAQTEGGSVVDAILGKVRDTGEDRTADDDEDQTVDADEGDDEDDTDQTDADEADEDGEDADDDTDDGEEADEDDQEQDGEYDEIAYSDDDVIVVTVDGEEVEATLSELKAAFAGEGAIEKRLKAATEAKKAADAVFTETMAEVTKQRTNLLQTIVQLDEVLFVPLIDPPDPKLRARNMNQYLLEKDAYDEDQKRIVSARETLREALAKQVEAQNAARQEYRRNQQAILMEKVPELASPKTAPKVQQEIMEAANYYGFTPEQVGQVDHHGIFMMARDAARWLNVQKLKNSKNGGASPVGGTVKRKKLRSGGIAAIKTAAQKSAKERQAIAVKARSGAQDDVTALILSNARSKSKGVPNGRSSRNR